MLTSVNFTAMVKTENFARNFPNESRQISSTELKFFSNSCRPNENLLRPTIADGVRNTALLSPASFELNIKIVKKT